MSLKSRLSILIPSFCIPYWERVRTSPLGYRLARGAFWSLAGTLAANALALLATIFVARKLGKVGFGELGIIQSTVGMFGTFAGFGLGLTATKHVAEFRINDPAKSGRIIALSAIVAIVTGGLMAVLLCCLAPWLAARTLAASQLTGLLRIGTLLLFLGALNGSQTGALFGFESFKTIAQVNFLGSVVAFPLVVGGAYLDGIYGAVWGLVGSMAVSWALNHLALRKEMARASVPVTFARCFEEWPILVAFSLPASLASALVIPAMWGCNAMLVNQGSGYSEMGMFNAAQQWRVPLLFVASLLTQITLPIISERLSSRSPEEVRRVLKTASLISLCACLPVCLIVIGLSKPIMMWYGPGFARGWPVLALLQIAAFLQVIQSPSITTLQATGRAWTHFFLNGIWCTVLLIACYALIDEGALGLAFAQVLAFLLYWPFLTIAARRILNRATHQ